MIKNIAPSTENQTGRFPSAGKRDDSEEKKTRIQYEKPEALDIGPVAPILGASCVGKGNNVDSGNCANVGISATANCATGTGVTSCAGGSGVV